ncbi:methyltransferase domain-containing protein [Hyalangium rubrum]|uniref:Methyltransferase domain-containing protein n=1 Tax=Hyalangium rubrum TaxID=3103134 RepID=A0ABU5GVR2_9BACT|nr:methyltransferase domain-containing protein [Hyalangium sp. s54d21]MDY7225278.1 methyltransferase domain-containing protein [Hyalangium sp. s54d21]
MSGYLMESEAEARRLAEQAKALPVHGHLITTGLAPGMKALDAGCGPGIISAVMGERVGPQGSVLGVDLHPQRLAEARAHCAALPQCSFKQGDVRKMDLPSDTFDYVWCQFVLEYLPDPQGALAELIRVTRPGGRVVVSDVDGMGQLNWPFPAELEADGRKFAAVVAAAGFDLHVGRKMFHFYRKAGLEQIRVHLAPTWLVAGAADARLLDDWRQRFATLEPLMVPAFGGKEAYSAFCERYLGLLSDPDALKYSVLLITEGQKR